MTLNPQKLFESLKLIIKSNYYIFKLLRLPLAGIGYYQRKLNVETDEFWREKIRIVTQAPDNDRISRVRQAGQIVGDVQIMHNGIKIHVGSYYGDGNTVLLSKNRGVHEPQEEWVFKEILKYMPHEAVMVELGAFWGFYSMSFQQKVKGGVSFLIEPDPHALASGKNNFKLNKLKGHFLNYYISDQLEEGKPPTITLNELLKQNRITHVNILHSDIQGFELKMLQGAKEYLLQGKIDYLFISTHTNELHEDCKKILLEHNYLILCDANLKQSYSWDGIIVAKYNSVDGPTGIKIALRDD